MAEAKDLGIEREYREFLIRTGLPFGSPMVYVPGVAAALHTENFASANYHVIEEAIRVGLQVEAHYGGHRRLFCPHVLGYSRRGNLNVLAYQFGGTSASGRIAAGSPDNWRCFNVDGLEIDGVTEGIWHSAPMASDQPQSCVVHVLVETDNEDARHRERIDPATGEITETLDNPWGRYGKPTAAPRPDPLAPPPHLIAALGSVHPELAELAHDFNRTSYKVVYQSEIEDCDPNFSELPTFNTLSVRLPRDLGGQFEAFRLAMRFIEACNPWVFILESDSRISEEFRSHVWTEAWLSDFLVMGTTAPGPGGNRLHVLIGNRGA